MLPSFWPKREDLKNAHRVRQGRLFNTSLAWHRRPFKVGPPPALPVLFPESCTLHLRFHLGEQTHTSAATPHSRPMADAVINQTCHSFSLGTDSASESFSTLYSGESPLGTLTWCARWNIFAVLHIKGRRLVTISLSRCIFSVRCCPCFPFTPDALLPPFLCWLWKLSSSFKYLFRCHLPVKKPSRAPNTQTTPQPFSMKEWLKANR